MNSTADRVLVLKIKDGTKPKSSTGMVDSRLFDGKNNLHVLWEPNGLWKLAYDHGMLPETLQQRFTSFKYAVQAAKEYLEERNVEIVDIKHVGT